MDWSVWERLGLELDRGAEQVYRRWWGGIEHVLTRHLAGKSSLPVPLWHKGGLNARRESLNTSSR